jgi:hypothetical protein
VGVVGCTGRVAPHRGVPVGGRGLVGRGGRGLRERAHAVQHLLEHVAQVGELTGDAGELLVDCRAPLLHNVHQVQGCDAVGVGFVHPLHVIIDPAGRFANLLDLLLDGFGEDRVFGAPCACSAGHSVYRLLKVGHDLSPAGPRESI